MGYGNIGNRQEAILYVQSWLQGDSEISIASQAKQIYETEFKPQLEVTHHGQFVAIEPQSKDYFVDHRFVDAAMAARRAYPDRQSFVIRIGYDAAFHIGSSTT